MSKTKIEKLGFLFGAGVSIPVGMPGTNKITKKILTGENIVRYVGSNCYSNGSMSQRGIPDEYVPGINHFLDLIRKEIEAYYCKKNYYINYEDIYYVIHQIHSSQLKEYENLAIQPFINMIRNKSRSILDTKKYRRIKDLEFNDLVSESLNYIKDVVCCMLNNPPENFYKLQVLKEMVEDNNINFIDIFTLNHDLVLENAFLDWNIDYNDGFSDPICNIKYWEKNLLYKKYKKVRLLKLHGSINWFRFRSLNNDSYYERIGIPLLSNHIDPEVINQMLLEERPLFLVGTFNKILYYTSGIFTTLFSEFNRSLDNLNTLIVSGYGFGDKGINNRIIEWTYSSEENTLIVIHPKPEELLESTRNAISTKWGLWEKSKKLIVISKGIEEIKWEDLKNKIQ